MREILLKAKTTPKEKGEFNNVWVYGDLIESNGKYYIHPKANTVNVNGNLGKIIVMHEVIPETICQYTGLTDKNGNKIWEGDVIHMESCEMGSPYYFGYEIVGKVIFDECAFFVEPKKVEESRLLFDECAEYEVIGNIFDNPKLVKE